MKRPFIALSTALLFLALSFWLLSLTVQSQTEIIIDNEDAEFSTNGPNWTNSTVGTGYIGSDYGFRNQFGLSEGAYAQWDFPASVNGTYDLYMNWPDGSNQPLDAVDVEIVTVSGVVTVTIDQTEDGGQWNLLGQWQFDEDGYVRILDAGGGRLVADAIRLYAASPPNCPSNPTPIVGSVIYDNDQPIFSANIPSDFTTDTQVTCVDDDYYVSTANGNHADWYIDSLDSEKLYHAYYYYPAHPDRGDVEVQVNAATTMTTIITSTQSGWIDLGGGYSPGDGDDIEILVEAQADGVVDAVALVASDPPPPCDLPLPAPPTGSITYSHTSPEVEYPGAPPWTLGSGEDCARENDYVRGADDVFSDPDIAFQETALGEYDVYFFIPDLDQAVFQFDGVLFYEDNMGNNPNYNFILDQTDVGTWTRVTTNTVVAGLNHPVSINLECDSGECYFDELALVPVEPSCPSQVSLLPGMVVYDNEDSEFQPQGGWTGTLFGVAECNQPDYYLGTGQANWIITGLDNGTEYEVYYHSVDHPGRADVTVVVNGATTNTLTVDELDTGWVELESYFPDSNQIILEASATDGVFDAVALVPLAGCTPLSSLPGGAIIIDDGDAGYSVSGTLADRMNDCSYNADYWRITSGTSGVISYTFSLTVGATYAITASIPAYDSAVSGVEYSIYSGAGCSASPVTIDQTQPGWQTLLTDAEPCPDGSITVTLPWESGAPYFNWVTDAVYVLQTSGPPPTPTPTPPPVITGTLEYVYTHTLESGHLLAVPVKATFGQLIIACIVLAMATVYSLDFLFRLVYRR